jgi:PST family polysaccharide transporter
VFGQKWVTAGAVPILVLICLSALSRPFANAASMLLRSVGLPQVDLIWNMAFTVVLTLGVLVGTGWGGLGVAAAVAVIHLGLQPLYLLLARRLVFGQGKSVTV